jgi:phosphatidate cytidylyltransferase
LAEYPAQSRPGSMLRQRILVILLLLPIGICLIVLGGWFYLAAIALILGSAAWEWSGLFQTGGLRPARPLIMLGVIALTAARQLGGFGKAPLLLSLICLIAMTWHMIDYEHGAVHSGTDMAVTMAGTLYLGWVGSYLVSLRTLAGGVQWLLTVLLIIWAADTAAYGIGKTWGRHRLAAHLSPKKTWEGYLAGVAAGSVAGTILAPIWQTAIPGMPGMSIGQGLLLGTAIGALAPLGDLGISMIKREMGVKDTGRLLPGHGGMLDRVDSWIWAAVIGYYLVVWLA